MGPRAYRGKHRERGLYPGPRKYPHGSGDQGEISPKHPQTIEIARLSGLMRQTALRLTVEPPEDRLRPGEPVEAFNSMHGTPPSNSSGVRSSPKSRKHLSLQEMDAGREDE